MAHLYTSVEPISQYWDKRSASSRQEWLEKVKYCTTVYAGNLAFHSTEEQLLELFSKVGQVKRIVMGLNRRAKNPCGFCFLQFFTHTEADRCVKLLNGSLFDDRIIKVDLDSGEGLDDTRKYGRGPRGYQWRDEFRVNYDEARGGEGGKLDPMQLNNYSRKRQREQAEEAPTSFRHGMGSTDNQMEDGASLWVAKGFGQPMGTAASTLEGSYRRFRPQFFRGRRRRY